MPARGYEFYLRILTRYLTSERSERIFNRGKLGGGGGGGR